MAEIEDAEAEIAAQEPWGLSRVGVATKRLTAAVRILRARAATQDARLDLIERRLDAANIPKASPQ